MLEGLDRIEWASLSHAYGPAEDVPSMIRSMASGDQDVRQKAFYAAYGNIWHQGTVYEASAAAVPFLLELAEATGLPDRHRVLDLLFHLAHGSSYLDAHQHLDHIGDMLKRQRDFDDDLAREREWVQATTAAVAEGCPVYVGLLSDPEPRVRRHAARMLTCCPDSHRSVIIPALVKVFEADADAGARATALFAVAAMAATDEAELVGHALDDDEPLVRLSAALASSFFLGKAPTHAVIATLMYFLEDTDRVDYDALVFGEDCASDIGAALARVEGPGRAEVAERLLAVAESGRAAPLTVAEPLLQLTFGAPVDHREPNALTPVQKRAVEFVAVRAWNRLDDGGWSLFGNFIDLLEEFGLEKIGQKLAGYEPPAASDSSFQS